MEKNINGLNSMCECDIHIKTKKTIADINNQMPNNDNYTVPV